jgi:hypothetical protein
MSSNDWILRVKLNGEWEECRFASPSEALAAFSELAQDYRARLGEAILQISTVRIADARLPVSRYVN